LAESHSFRPSPLAIESINEIILDPVYLALTGNDLPFHSEFSFRKYEQIFHEFLEMLMKEGINRTAISLLLETEADRTVAAYLVSAFDAEKPSDSLAKYMPEIAATERKLQLVAKRLKELAKLPELPKSTPLQRSLFDSIPKIFWIPQTQTTYQYLQQFQLLESDSQS
jgi:hypothetical protein